MSAIIDRRVFVLAGATLAAAVGAKALKPTQRLSEQRLPIQLEEQVPKGFGPWSLSARGGIILPNPELQASLDALYTQLIARTYTNVQGREVMLTIAYGNDQGSEATAVHRPEFCYAAQGFRVENHARRTLELDAGRRLTVQELITSLGHRVEPVSYWITLDQKATLPGFGRKIEQIVSGLQGLIPDGMLIRVSSIASNANTAAEFDLHQVFLRDLFMGLRSEVRPRYFGI